MRPSAPLPFARALAALVLTAVAVRAASAQTRAEEARTLAQGIEVLQGVRVPMRDGIRLSGVVFLPRGRSGPLPTILTLSPYLPAERNYDEAVYFARSGYAYVAVDSRGRGNSEGAFVPFEHDGRDAYDAVEWLARQPWSDGRVGMWGRSYNGFVGWAALKHPPPHLRSLFSAAASLPGFDFPWLRNNVGTLHPLRWLALVSGRTANWPMYEDEGLWRERFEALYAAGLPYARYDSVAGVLAPHWRTWLRHPHPDAYYDSLSPTPTEYARIRIPILTVAGHFPADGNAPGAMEYHRRHMEHGDPRWTARHFLVKGPWDHAGTTLDTIAYDMRRLAREWFDWTLRDGERPPLLRDRIAYLVGPGRAEWRHASSLDAIPASTRLLYLTPSIDPRGDAGTLTAEPATSGGTLRFASDPLETRRPAPAAPAPASEPAAAPARPRTAHLFFESAPVDSGFDLVGAVRVALWLSMDVPDTDIEVQLAEVRADGSTRWQSIDRVRARYRASLREPRPVVPGRIEEYRLAIPFMARRVEKGSRLRVRVGAPAGLQQNYNGGGLVAFESRKDARTAHVQLHTGPGHPSRIELPAHRP